MPPCTHRTEPARRRRSARRPAVALLALVACVAAACGTGSTASTTSTTAATAATTSLVKPPPLTLQGCNYEVNGVVPPGMSTGTQPPFAAFGPDQAGTAALRHIQAHGGTALVDGFTIPPGTVLRAGPATSGTPVGTVPGARSLLLAEPVLWTTSSGQHWLATFLACGGSSLYWIQVSQISSADRSVGTQVANSIATALAAPATSTGVSARPIVIDADHHFAWASGTLSFAIARGLYQGF